MTNIWIFSAATLDSSLTAGKPGAGPEATADRARPRETHEEPSYCHGHGDVDSDADGTTPHRARNGSTFVDGFDSESLMI